MDKVVLRVPMSKSLRDKATKIAKEEGFSSLQELIRVFLTQYAKRRFILTPILDDRVETK